MRVLVLAVLACVVAFGQGVQMPSNIKGKDIPAWINQNVPTKDAAGNVTIRTTLLGQQKVVPTLAASAVTIADGNNLDPYWLSMDRSTLYSGGTNTLYKSTDGGANWTVVKAGFSASIAGVRDLANGELLISISANGATPGSLWLSSGYPQLGTAATWTKVLDAGANNSGTPTFSGTWGMSTYGAVVVVSEYGMQNAPTNWARYAYISTDSGATWTQIYDIGTTPGLHIHGTAYDPWWDAVWLVTGDKPAGTTVQVSWDRGSTWQVVSTGGVQYVGILPMENGILFTTDDTPTGVHRIDRTANRSVSAPTPIYIINASATSHVGTMPFRAYGPGMPALLPFLAQNGSGIILATYDGLNFSTLWTDTATYTVKGPQRFVGPTTSGVYAGTLLDDRQANPSRITIPAAPLPDVAGINAERTKALKDALVAFGSSASGRYITGQSTGNPLAEIRTEAQLFTSPIYLNRDVSLDRIGVRVTVGGSAGAVIRLGIYGSDANGMPGALVLDAGTVDGTQTGFLELTINQSLSAGRYWLAGVSQGGAGTRPTAYAHTGHAVGISTLDPSSMAQYAYSGFATSGVSGALPAALDMGATAPDGAPMRVFVRVK